MSEKSFHEDGGDYGDEDMPDDGSEIIIESDKEEDDDDLIVGGRGNKRVPDSERITSRFMTKYERARILGTRAL